MHLDPDNTIVRLCAKGMEQEGAGNTKEAEQLFQQAWHRASKDEEKCIAAHYVARHQNNATDKLRWDVMALRFATQSGDGKMAAFYPSLYLNIAKGFEDLNDLDNARDNYQSALSFLSFLPNDGYREMIRRGIADGMKRTEGDKG